MAAYDPKARRPPVGAAVDDGVAPVDAILAELPTEAPPVVVPFPEVVPEPATARPALSVVGSPVPAVPAPGPATTRAVAVAAAVVAAAAVAVLVLRRRRR